MALRLAALAFSRLQLAAGAPAAASIASRAAMVQGPSTLARLFSSATATSSRAIAVPSLRTAFASPSFASRAHSTSATTPEEESLEEVRSRIFGTHIGNGLRSGRKVLRRRLIGQKLVDWYPEDVRRKDPFMLSLKAEAAKLKLDRLRRRGKAPPKKGAGKRAGKKKK